LVVQTGNPGAIKVLARRNDLAGPGADEYLLIRGNGATPKEIVPRRFLEAFGGGGYGPRAAGDFVEIGPAADMNAICLVRGLGDEAVFPTGAQCAVTAARASAVAPGIASPPTTRRKR
jgi:hypothetical protein